MRFVATLFAGRREIETVNEPSLKIEYIDLWPAGGQRIQLPSFRGWTPLDAAFGEVLPIENGYSSQNRYTLENEYWLIEGCYTVGSQIYYHNAQPKPQPLDVHLMASQQYQKRLGKK